MVKLNFLARNGSYSMLWVLVLGITLGSYNVTLAQGKPYKKKVVSFIDQTLMPSNISMEQRQANYIRNTIKKAINFERFNYASLPDTMTRAFAEEVSAQSRLTPETIGPVLDKTLAPQLLQILDLNKELLSQQNLSEADRNTFLATKAKAAGLTAEQLESILNSGFFYVPFVNSYHRSAEKGSREVKNDKGKVIRHIPFVEYTHSLRLGILWYQLKVDRNNTPQVVFAGQAKGWDDGPIDRSATHDLEDLSGDKIPEDGTEDFSAFTEAVNVSCFNIQNETKKLEAFKLTGEVTDASFWGVEMNLGTKEGLGLDDTYWIEEFEETVSGEVVKVKRGFVKIRNVGDNKKDETATSYAQTITGSNYSMGLSVTEIPLLGINGLIGFGVFPVSIAKFDNRPPSDQFLKSGDDYNFALTVTAEHKTAFGAVAAVQTSLANTARISEFWAHAGGGIAIIAPEGKFYISKFTSSGSSAGIDSIEIAPALTGYVQVGAVKKFYFRRFGIVAQADLKYALTSFTASGKDKKNDKDVTYKLLNGTIGADVRAALEIYMTPTISVGAGAEYNLFAANTSWSATVTDSDNNDLTKNDNAKGPEINYGGLAFSLWVNYSLPSLK